MAARPLLDHRILVVAAAFLGLAATFAASPARAAWPNDSLTNVRVCTGPGPESEAVAVSSATLGHKAGVIVAWTDQRAGASNTDVYAQRIFADGSIDWRWPAAGLPVCALEGEQQTPAIVPDGSGGAIIVWQDRRPYDGDGLLNVYAQHVRANGTFDPAWPTTGAPVCRAAGEQGQVSAVSDGGGGVIVAWADTRSGGIDIYANHLLSNGAVHGSWPADGRVVCNDPYAQFSPRAVSDGAGGAILTWSDSRGSGDIYVQRMDGTTGLPAWTPNGVALCALASGQGNPSIVSDGAGGAIVAWEDQRAYATNSFDIFVQHVTAAGVVDAGWPADGRQLPVSSMAQAMPAAVADGAGGALVVYLDYRYSPNGLVTGHHVKASGAADAAWGTGVALCEPLGSQLQHQAVSDGAGGVLTCWNDSRNGADIYAAHALSSGELDARWRFDGNPLCLASGGQTAPVLTAVEDGDAIAVWADFRSGTGRLYAQRFTSAGSHGMSAPNIAGVLDVPSDQGGKVHVLWDHSALDEAPLAAIADYRLWRRIMLGPIEAWEFLAQVPARGVSGYAFMALTPADSSAAGPAWNTFRVTAHAAAGLTTYTSGIASGQSVDNLAPAAPQQLTGGFENGTTTLAWVAPADPDVAAYRLYRGDGADFTPGPATLLAEIAGTSFADAAGAPRWYRVSAVDTHGNEGPTALLAPSAVAGAGPPGLPATLALSPPRPNPARGAAELELAMPSGAHVSCAVYDVGGRLVRVLHDAPLPPGTHRLAWDTADGGGAPVAGGLYFIRLEVAGARFVRRLAVLR